MNNNKSTDKVLIEKKRWAAIAFLVMIATAVLFVWWIIHLADRDIKNELLQQAQLIAQSVNFKRIQALSGTESDLTLPDYRRIKTEKSSFLLTASRSAPKTNHRPARYTRSHPRIYCVFLTQNMI